MEKEAGVRNHRTLLILGSVGAILMNIACTIMVAFTFYKWVFPSSQPDIMFIVAVISSILFLIGLIFTAFGFYGIYVAYGAWMGMVSLIFTVLTTIFLTICTVLPVIQPAAPPDGYGGTVWFYIDWQTFKITFFYWLGLAILGITNLLQGLTFLLSRSETGLTELSLLNGIILIATGSFLASYFGSIIGLILLFASGVLSVIIFLKARLP